MENAENVIPLRASSALEPTEYTLTYTLPNGRQITSRTVVKDASRTDEALDTIAAALNRLRSKYEIGTVYGEEDTLDYEIDSHVEAMAKADRELAVLDKATDAKIEKLRSEHTKALSDYKSAYNQGQASAEEKGRIYDPDKGANRAALQKHIGLANGLDEEIKKLESDRAQGHANHKTNMAVFEEKIAHLRAKRDARVTLIGAVTK